jgi:hypothetical protein
MKACEHWLKQVQPLMRTPNRTEFKQRLQWLSEGMLHEHLETFGERAPSIVAQREREDYAMFCKLRTYEDLK